MPFGFTLVTNALTLWLGKARFVVGRPCRHRKVGGRRPTCDISVPETIRRNAFPRLAARRVSRAAEVGGVEQHGARRVHLRDKCVGVGQVPDRGLEGSCRHRKVGGLGVARDISVAGAIDCNGACGIATQRASRAGDVA